MDILSEVLQVLQFKSTIVRKLSGSSKQQIVSATVTAYQPFFFCAERRKFVVQNGNVGFASGRVFGWVRITGIRCYFASNSVNPRRVQVWLTASLTRTA
jgi:hypothetical protein